MSKKTMGELLNKVIDKVAVLGAESTSVVIAYQPELPKCLRKNEEDLKQVAKK